MQTIIKATNLSKFIQSDAKRAILKTINFSLEEGEFVAIMGPSGSGKSTLLFALSGLDTIDEGEVLFSDQAISSLDDRAKAKLRREGMGFIFQHSPFLANLDILENIVLAALKSGADKDSTRKKALDLMESLGIKHLANQRINTASGGELQRAGICRALINDPQVIFADEPTGALNSKSSEEVISILERINENGTSILMVTHDAKIASRAQKVIFIKDGELVDALAFGPLRSDERLNLVLEKMQALDI